MQTKLANLQVKVSKETGEVMLFIETACGFRPVMGWPDINRMEAFAMALLAICSQAVAKDSTSD